MIDKVLVQEVLDRIEGDVDHWDQEEYVTSCGSTLCFAGWAMVLRGYAVVNSGSADCPWYNFQTPDGVRIEYASDMEIEAQDLLGFDDDATWEIFHWQPDDHLPIDEDYEVYASKAEQFAAFKEHVLVVTGIKGDTEA